MRLLQHPYARLFVAYLVTFCNFLIYAEDPVAHSAAECNIIVVGNIYSFVITKYPPNGFSVLKVFLWIVAIIVGILIGKLVIHRILLSEWLLYVIHFLLVYSLEAVVCPVSRGCWCVHAVGHE